jgi:phenylglyoxylate dehydrogenase alpha subunit
MNPDNVKYMDGNTAAAYGVALCRPDVIAVYPVTPQTQLAEMLAQFRAQGVIDAEMVEVEGETSAVGVIYGASAAGGRVFTATSGAGLKFMHDGYVMAGMSRLPLVMVNVSRELNAPWLVAPGEQDIMSELDSGWVHLHVENCQEILDSLIMAFKLAEDQSVQCAVTVCYDGYYLSHLSERVYLPDPEEVGRFVPKRPEIRARLSEGPIACGVSFVPPSEVAEYRKRHLEALERVKTRLQEIDEEFRGVFGRGYGGQIEEYEMENAEFVLVTVGSCSGTARVAVDRMRREGVKVGLVKVRLFRPFPRERLAEVLEGRKAVGAVDRNVCFGWNAGHLLIELRAALWGKREVPLLNFIDGLGGGDITVENLEKAIDRLVEASRSKTFKVVHWLQLE